MSNIDFLPTMLDLAGIEYAVNDYDGMSWVRGGILNASNSSISNYSKIENWRDRLLIQYGRYGSGDADFSHCRTWYPAANGSFRGYVPNPPASNALGQRWIMDDGVTNNWRAIRILNETMNAVYAEFVNDYSDLTLLNDPNFIEFYDIDSDPHQMDNVYIGLDDSTKQELHEMLIEYAVCSGMSCWWRHSEGAEVIDGDIEIESTFFLYSSDSAEVTEVEEENGHHFWDSFTSTAGVIEVEDEIEHHRGDSFTPTAHAGVSEEEEEIEYHFWDLIKSMISTMWYVM